MPLENTATVKDIITSLQDMEGINAKADLASVVGSPATSNDSMATINNVIQQAKNDLADKTDQDNTAPLQSLVNNMVVGQKKATGIVSAGTSQISVSNLSFKPSIVTINYQKEDTKYISTINNIYKHTSTGGRVLIGSHVGVAYDTFSKLEIIEQQGINNITDTGFNIKPWQSPDSIVNWTAYE